MAKPVIWLFYLGALILSLCFFLLDRCALLIMAAAACRRWGVGTSNTWDLASDEDSVWQQEAGPTVFDPQPETSDLSKGTDKVWMTRGLIPTAGSPACTTLKEIRSTCGNLQSQPPRGGLLNSPGLFLLVARPQSRQLLRQESLLIGEASGLSTGRDTHDCARIIGSVMPSEDRSAWRGAPGGNRLGARRATAR